MRLRTRPPLLTSLLTMWETNSEVDSERMSSEAVTDDECPGNSTNCYKPPCAVDHFMGGSGYSRSEHANLALLPPVAVADPSSVMSIEADILKSSSPAKSVHCGATSSAKWLQAKVRHKPNWHAFASVARRGGLCVRPNVVQLVRNWCSEREIHKDVDVFSKHPPLALAPKIIFTGVQEAFVQRVGKFNLVGVATHKECIIELCKRLLVKCVKGSCCFLPGRGMSRGRLWGKSRLIGWR